MQDYVICISMKLTIVTINRNNLAGLQRTLQSVQAQTCTDFEHVVIDGASTDGSAQLVADYAAHAPYAVKWLSEPDSGIYNAMNKGIGMATGDYIEILNSGDALASADVVERMFAALAARNYPEIMYGNMLKTSDWQHFHRDRCGDSSWYTPQSFLYFYCGTLNHDCAYIRRSLFERFGLYNEQMRICSDWEWYIRAIVLGGVQAVYVNIDVTHFDMNGISESGNKNREIIQRERREYLEKIVPAAVLWDYDHYAFPMEQYRRLQRHHLWGAAWFVERVLFKLEKWGILR